MTVCTSPDKFVRELEIGKGLALWRAQLSNGEVVIQDDHRPGVTPPQAWLRLADYLKTHDLAITKFWLQFRGNIRDKILPENADGYYFCKSALRFVSGGRTAHYYLLGVLQSRKVMVTRWKVPELQLVEVEERDPLKAGQCLILNPWRSLDGSAEQGT